jgi:hypothetical protein
LDLLPATVGDTGHFVWLTKKSIELRKHKHPIPQNQEVSGSQKPREFLENTLDRASSTISTSSGHVTPPDLICFLSSSKNGTLNRVFRRHFYFPQWGLRVVFSP